MSYVISLTDVNNNGVIEIPDMVVDDDQTSIAIPGVKAPNYGSAIAKSLLHMLENFSSPSDPNKPLQGGPRNPLQGQLWFDNTEGYQQLKVFNGTTWSPSGGLHKSTEFPPINLASDPYVGDLLSNYTDNRLYMYNGLSWDLVGPEFDFINQTGVKTDVIDDVSDNPHPVIKFFVEGDVYGIFSNADFTPSDSIDGYNRISQGFNFGNTLDKNNSAPVVNNAIGFIEYDCRYSRVFLHVNIQGDFTPNLVNLNLGNDSITTITVIMLQRSTTYMIQGLEIDAIAQEILWKDNTLPTEHANKIDVVTYTIMRHGEVYRVVGDSSVYG